VDKVLSSFLCQEKSEIKAYAKFKLISNFILKDRYKNVNDIKKANVENSKSKSINIINEILYNSDGKKLRIPNVLRKGNAL